MNHIESPDLIAKHLRSVRRFKIKAAISIFILWGRTREPPENLSAEIDTYIYIHLFLRGQMTCALEKDLIGDVVVFFVRLIQMKAGPQWFHCWCHLCA